MKELKVGDIVRCDDHKGLWKVTKISKGKNFKNSYYARISKILEEDYTKPENEEILVCNITMCYKVSRPILIEILFSFQDKINNLIKIIG